jgi:phytoene dehydrogenase-like protein
MCSSHACSTRRIGLRDRGIWDAARRNALTDRVTATIESFAPGFKSRIQHRAAWTPLDLEERFGLREGATSHGELGLDQILFMRPVQAGAGMPRRSKASTWAAREVIPAPGCWVFPDGSRRKVC